MLKKITAKNYADTLAIQLRKGFLAYCVLRVCSDKAIYTSDIIGRLKKAELMVVEGTLYPLLSRLKKDELLDYEWKESMLGPPRKYYKTTPYGNEVMKHIAKNITALHTALERL